ncbi:hypothetical protein [uncultured Polaribacter sp.]|nr:hypothetical protein [uncultured Polaribacter sp.]
MINRVLTIIFLGVLCFSFKSTDGNVNNTHKEELQNVPRPNRR